MNARSPRRTDLLLKVYVGLFLVCLALGGVLVQRQLAGGGRHGESTIAVAAPRETPAPRNLGPGINWGGAKR